MYLSNSTLLQGGKYKIVRHISSGGFGCTYEAYDTMMDTKVAIKEFFVKDYCVRDEATSHITLTNKNKRELMEKLRQKFIDEARALFKMKHDNIVHVNTFFEENGTAYYVMEYIDGLSLSDILKKRGSLSETEMLGYIRQVAAALKFVHQQNRLHLDIKPGNILVDKTGKAVLIDFGASKHYDEGTGENTTTMQGLNTPGYAPYEQTVEGITEFKPASDIYALGATMYKLLTGETPPNSGLLALKKKTLAPLPESISVVTRNAIAAAMQLHEEDRPQTVEAFLSLLDYSDDEDTVCEGDELKRQAEEARRRAEEQKRKEEEARRKAEEAERKRKEEEEKARNTAKKSGSKNIWLWVVIGLIAVVGIVIGINSNGGSSANDNAVKSGSYASYNNGVLKVDAVTYDMVKVQAGTFTMGETAEMKDPSDNGKPTHQVTLTNDYYIGKTEVTQALWKAVMGNNPSRFKGDNLPVETVSWNNCQEFISKLNSLTGKNFRLPTEAEWEFAARGGNNSNHYQYSGSNQLGDVAWYWHNSGDKYLKGTDNDWDIDKIEKNHCKTHPVATKSPNELGIYDMSGNVWEWCSDWYGNYSSSSQTNPKGPNSGSDRVFRGGSWINFARLCRSSYRNYYTPDDSFNFLGLRLVLVP